jgi:hypothetical protein
VPCSGVGTRPKTTTDLETPGDAIAHVDDLVWFEAGGADELLEELEKRLLGSDGQPLVEGA